MHGPPSLAWVPQQYNVTQTAASGHHPARVIDARLTMSLLRTKPALLNASFDATAVHFRRHSSG